MVVSSPNCFPSPLTAITHPAMTPDKITATKGVLRATVPTVTRRPWWIKDPPDFPILDPTQSIAAFPLSLHSFDKGMKASSFVASNKVYLDALAKQF